MAKYAGRLFLLKRSDGNSPETFTTIAGLRSTSFSINNEQIDVTDKDDSTWRKLIEGGVRSLSLSGSGLLQDATVHANMLTAALNGTISRYRVVFANNRFLTASFQMSGLEESGEYNDAQQYSVNLESAGDVEVA